MIAHQSSLGVYSRKIKTQLFRLLFFQHRIIESVFSCHFLKSSSPGWRSQRWSMHSTFSSRSLSHTLRWAMITKRFETRPIQSFVLLAPKVLLGAVHILRNTNLGSRETPPPLCNIVINWEDRPLKYCNNLGITP